MTRTSIAAAIFSAWVAFTAGASAETASKIFVIGDSLNDTGTFAPITATGRFTTTPGLIWTEVVAATRGESVAPAFFFTGETFVRNEGGTNYAQSGTLVSGEQGLFNGVSKPVTWQVDRLLEHRNGNLGGAVVLMDGGGPDIVIAAVQVQNGEATPEQATARVEQAARELAGQARRIKDAGAGTLALLGVANFGTTPLFGAGRGEAAPFLTALSQTFNSALADEAAKLGIADAMLDVYGFFDNLIASPSEHGLKNVVAPAVDPARAPATPTGNSANSGPWHLVEAGAARTYLFADGLHPSGRGHELLAAFVLEKIGRE